MIVKMEKSGEIANFMNLLGSIHKFRTQHIEFTAESFIGHHRIEDVTAIHILSTVTTGHQHILTGLSDLDHWMMMVWYSDVPVNTMEYLHPP